MGGVEDIDPTLSRPGVDPVDGGAGAADEEALSRRERGLRNYASQFGVSEEEVAQTMREMLGEHMAREAWESSAEAWTDKDLSMRDRSLVVIACLVTQGGVEPRLRGHLRWALVNGATRAELRALMALLAVYIGYPRASVGMELLRQELGDED